MLVVDGTALRLLRTGDDAFGVPSRPAARMCCVHASAAGSTTTAEPADAARTDFLPGFGVAVLGAEIAATERLWIPVSTLLFTSL